MKDFHHKNVIRLIGVYLENDSLPMIVLPYMRIGSLLDYIRSDTNYLTIKNLLKFALDVAKGMNYLSKLQFVHRDLAGTILFLNLRNVIEI